MAFILCFAINSMETKIVKTISIRHYAYARIDGIYNKSRKNFTRTYV